MFPAKNREPGSVFVGVLEVTSLVALNTFNQFVTH